MKYLVVIALLLNFVVKDAQCASLPVPRFVSLSSGKVNMRTGPGLRYPIDWVLTKRNLPIEVVNDFDNWVNVKDVTGDEGWVHKSMISSRRYVVVTKKLEPLFQKKDISSPVMGRAERGVIARVIECSDSWCKIKSQNVVGWAKKSAIWGVYDHEIIED